MYLLRLGHSIRVAREACGLSQAELSERAGVSRPTISLLENGLVSDLGVRKVAAIADVLGLTLYDVSFGAETFVQFAVGTLIASVA